MLLIFKVIIHIFLYWIYSLQGKNTFSTQWKNLHNSCGCMDCNFNCCCECWEEDPRVRVFATGKFMMLISKRRLNQCINFCLWEKKRLHSPG